MSPAQTQIVLLNFTKLVVDLKVKQQFQLFWVNHVLQLTWIPFIDAISNIFKYKDN